MSDKNVIVDRDITESGKIITHFLIKEEKLTRQEINMIIEQKCLSYELEHKLIAYITKMENGDILLSLDIKYEWENIHGVKHEQTRDWKSSR